MKAKQRIARANKILKEKFFLLITTFALLGSIIKSLWYYRK